MSRFAAALQAQQLASDLVAEIALLQQAQQLQMVKTLTQISDQLTLYAIAIELDDEALRDKTVAQLQEQTNRIARSALAHISLKLKPDITYQHVATAITAITAP